MYCLHCAMTGQIVSHIIRISKVNARELRPTKSRRKRMAHLETLPEKSLTTTYKNLICQDDLRSDGNPLFEDQVPASLFAVAAEQSTHRCRLVAGCLGLLSVFLLAADIALGIHYHNIRNKELSFKHQLTQVSSELDQIRSNMQAKDEAQLSLAMALHRQSEVSVMQEYQEQQMRDFENRIQAVQEEQTNMKSHISQLEVSCAQCMPGWTLLNSRCYYFPFSDTIPRKGWKESRDTCVAKGGDLAVVDSWQKQEEISKLILAKYTDKPIRLSGFWIGLSDISSEGNWTWQNGVKMTQGYWEDGEPNDYYQLEDCVAIYPRSNFSKNWNDAPCTHPLKWICEKDR
ncbi:C-type lectin domain family 4 member G-like [Hypomesus transpacificus]|uniref:C-type lectin domain family 4 member G-like n=1 Tax=Hypomesus transpacificus TaxID=137520 RepID=UPI001F086EDC|nr:C-type lectin domain family 4 member G-like [Hypomesus transpacificus]